MTSVNATEKANHWQSLQGKELDREQEDNENLAFCDEQENLFRQKCKKAREDVQQMEVRKIELEGVVERTRRLCRTEIEYWDDGDFTFWELYNGNVPLNYF